MALHLGLHWNMILGMAKKNVGKTIGVGVGIVCRCAAICIAEYGLYAFFKNQFLAYMLLTSDFVFFDFERPQILFFMEYIGIMGLFIFLAHYTGKGTYALMGRRKHFAAQKEK